MKNKSSEYWKKRFLQLEEASNTYGQKTAQQIAGAFEEAEREIQKEIERWYGRYAQNNKVTLQEAKRQLTARELKELRWDVQKYIEMGRENAVDPLWLKELENASARAHISRLEALKLHIQQSAELAFQNELDQIDDMARTILMEDFYKSIYEVHKGFGIGWNIGALDQRKLDKLIVKPWAADGKNFSERIWSQRASLVNELHQQLTRACIMGKAPDDAIKAISKKFNTTKHQAGRLVMTEQAYFHAAAQKEAYEELDVEEFEIVATLDSHTSEICQELDGQHFPMSEYEPGVTAPPFHVWCRSVTVPYFEDNYTGERAARGEDGKTYYVPDDMTYPKWKKSLVDGDGAELEVLKERAEHFGLDKTDNFNEFKNKYLNASMSQRRAKLDEGIFTTLNATKADPIKPRHIMKEMRKSEIGRELLEYLEAEKVPVSLFYGIDNPDGYLGIYDPIDDEIGIFCDLTKTTKETALTVIHEAMHRKLGHKHTFEEEVKCYEAEVLHAKGKLTKADTDAIILFVKKKYPEYEVTS